MRILAATYEILNGSKSVFPFCKMGMIILYLPPKMLNINGV